LNASDNLPVAITPSPPARSEEPDAMEPFEAGSRGHPSWRSQLYLVAGTALITAGLIFTIVRLLDTADQSRLVQVAVRQVEAHANLIHSIEWEAIARREVTAESLAELRRTESQILGVTQALAAKKEHPASIDALDAACSEFVHNVDREIALVQSGQLKKARLVDRRGFDPSFRRIQQLADLISDGQSRAAEKITFTSRIALIAAALFSTSMILVYFRRFNIQRYRTRLARAQQLLAQKNEDRFRTLTEKSTDVIMITAPKGEITYLSPSASSVLGWSGEEAIGTSIFERIHPDDAPLVQNAFGALVAVEESATIEFRLGHADGTYPDFECVTRNLVHDVNIQGLLLNARDVTQDKRVQSALAFNAAHDPLTRLPNRAVFMDRLQMVIERKKRHPGSDAAILFLDLDDLKLVNDGLGHEAGDSLIDEFAKRLRACIRSEDTMTRPHEMRVQGASLATLARVGGDEFIILLEEVRDPSDAVRVAQRIQALMAEPFVLQGQEIFKSVSIGIAFTSGEIDARTLIANADIAMYRAKANGESRCEVFNAEMHAQITRRLELELALRRALEGNQFRLQYQPIVSLVTGSIVGFEALVRWQRPNVGLVAPGEFIAVAEQIGLIVPLGDWVLLESCRQAVTWNAAGSAPAPYISVNVSARQFSYPGFVDHVRETLHSTGIRPQRLKLEITEGTAMEDPERAIQLMSQLTALGVTLSIDDFGTGYSSLSSLRRFPVKTLKIDRSFVSAIHTNPQVAAIVTAIIDLARMLSMEVVAEGVENLEQLKKLRTARCDCAQGFLFSFPLFAEAVHAVIATDLTPRLASATSRAAASASQ
jgi:diguanylate cyclase (GGDEF)-like protein/PAS domain S-box-containing protein